MTPSPKGEQHRRHILMVTISALGHLMPLLELAKKLVRYHHVTFAVSASRLAGIRENGLTVDLDDLGITLLGIEDNYPYARWHTPEEFLMVAVPGFANFFTDVFNGNCKAKTTRNGAN